MTKLKISILMITVFFLSAYQGLSDDDVMLLCMSPADQYVVTVDPNDGCLEEESPVKIKGSGMAEMKDLTPVAVFANNDNCETEGNLVKLGFDKNNNYKLDEEEVMSISETCKVAEEE